MIGNASPLSTFSWPDYEINLYQAFVSLGSIAGIISLIWNMKAAKPQIRVSAREGIYYPEASSNVRDRIIIISVVNKGKVPIKIQHCGFIIFNGKDQMEILDDFPSRQLISGERHDRYFSSIQLTRRILSFPGLIVDFGDLVMIRALCKDQSGRIFSSKIFGFNIKFNESTLPKSRFLGPGVSGSSISKRKWWRIFFLQQNLKRKWQKHIHPDLHKRRIEDMRKTLEAKHRAGHLSEQGKLETELGPRIKPP